MPEIQTVVIPGSVAVTLITVIAGAIRWSGSRRARAEERRATAARQEAQALVENARASALLAARVEALDRSESVRSKLDQVADRLSAVVNQVRRALPSDGQVDHALDHATHLVGELGIATEQSRGLVDELEKVVARSERAGGPAESQRLRARNAADRARAVVARSREDGSADED